MARTVMIVDDSMIMTQKLSVMVRDLGHNPTAPPGSATTHLCLGPGFSSACT